MGGLFTPQPSELTGNITCITDPSKKIMGYIEPVKNITQKRIFVHSTEISGSRFFDCETMDAGELAAYLSDHEITYDQFYMIGFRPAGEINPSTGMPFEWSIARCTDCVVDGGSKKKPDFWPNNDE